MANPLQEFTAERWGIVKSILAGDQNNRVSLTAAAREAGIDRKTLRGWIRRSEEQRPEDDPLIHEVAEFMRSVDRLQADRLEDVVWERSIEGWEEPVWYKGKMVGTKTRFDNKMLMKLLEVREERYRPRSTHVNVNLNDPSEIYARLLGGRRNAIAKQKAEEMQIDLTPDQYHEVEAVEELPPDAIQPNAWEDDGGDDFTL